MLIYDHSQRVFSFYMFSFVISLGPEQVLAHSTTIPVMSSNIKFQELPEFRLDNALIDAFTKYKSAKSTTTTESTASEESTLGYTKIKIHETEVNLNDPFLQEFCHSAKSILEVVKLRDKYLFEHCQCKILFEILVLKRSNRFADWRLD